VGVLWDAWRYWLRSSYFLTSLDVFIPTQLRYF
jgi:hypothetical protein